MRVTIAVLLLLAACSGPTSTDTIVKDDTYNARTMMLNYGGPAMARYYRSAPATAHHFNGARIGIANIRESTPGTVPKAHAALWSNFAAHAPGGQVMYLPESPTNLYTSNDPATNFLGSLHYLQQLAAQYQLDYMIIYKTDILSHGDKTVTGDAMEASVEALPGVAKYPVGFMMVAATAPFPHATRALVGYTDIYLVDVRAGTVTRLRSFSDVVDINVRVLGSWREKQDEARETLPKQALQRALDQLLAR